MCSGFGNYLTAPFNQTRKRTSNGEDGLKNSKFNKYPEKKRFRLIVAVSHITYWFQKSTKGQRRFRGLQAYILIKPISFCHVIDRPIPTICQSLPPSGNSIQEGDYSTQTINNRVRIKLLLSKAIIRKRKPIKNKLLLHRHELWSINGGKKFNSTLFGEKQRHRIARSTESNPVFKSKKTNCGTTKHLSTI